MRVVRAAVFGALAGAVLAYAGAAVIALAVAAGGGGVDIGIGPLAAVGVESGDGGTSFTLGPLLLVVPVVTAAANAVAAWFVARRGGAGRG
jgi:hypothetical protein